VRHEIPRSKQKLQPTNDTAAMWANDLRFSSHASHFCALRPIAKLKLSTFRLCHATSTGSATSPSILRDIRFTNQPYKPVSSAFGIRVLLAMFSSRCRCLRHEDTGHETDVTPLTVIATGRG